MLNSISPDVPGSTVDVGPNAMPNIAPGDFGLTSNAGVGNGWVSEAVDYMDGGLPPATNVVSHLGDEPVTYSYALNTWIDGTHLYIQEGMLLFGAKHVDTKHKTLSGAPIFKLNSENTVSMTAFKIARLRAGSEAAKFNRLIEKHGEAVLDSYHTDLKKGNTVENDGELREYHRMAQLTEFRYLTQFGIKSLWNFLGAVVSKGESTGAGVSLDMFDGSDMLFIVGISAAKRAECLNLWGNVSSGSKVFLILMRADKNSPLQWIPYSDRSREYPERQFRTYIDASGRICKSFILEIGTVSETISKVPSQSQIDQASGLFGTTVKDAFDAQATLGLAILQLGV